MAEEYLFHRPEDCVVIGDAAAGINAAKDDGLTAAGPGEAAEYYALNTFFDVYFALIIDALM